MPNWIFIGAFALAAIALVAFLIRQNQRDERDFEREENAIDEAEDSGPESEDDDI